MRLVSAVVGVLVVSTLTACATQEPGEPGPTAGGPTERTTTQAPTTTTSSSEPTGPNVPNPVDDAKFQDDPCLGLTAAQADELGVDHPGDSRPVTGGKACTWTNANSGMIELAWQGSTPIGNIYAAHERGDLEFLEPVADIGGLPAVSWDGADRRARGYCKVTVGTSDESSFTVALRQSNGRADADKVCSVAADVAGHVVDTVKAG